MVLAFCEFDKHASIPIVRETSSLQWETNDCDSLVKGSLPAVDINGVLRLYQLTPANAN